MNKHSALHSPNNGPVWYLRNGVGAQLPLGRDVLKPTDSTVTGHLPAHLWGLSHPFIQHRGIGHLLCAETTTDPGATWTRPPPSWSIRCLGKTYLFKSLHKNEATSITTSVSGGVRGVVVGVFTSHAPRKAFFAIHNTERWLRLAFPDSCLHVF